MKRLICIIVLAGLCLGVDGISCNWNWPFLPSDTGGTQGINGGDPAGQKIPESGVSVGVRVISESTRDADVLVIFFVDGLEVHRTELRVPAGALMDVIGPDLANSITAQGTFVGGGDTPFVVYVDFVDGDIVEYIIPADEIKDEPIDECPSDPDKMEPGQCGCGNPDTDSDEDGTADCNDECPDDPNKVEPGDCDCGNPDTDDNNNGISDCKESKGGPGPGPVIVTQACCFEDGSCGDLTESACIESGGTPQGSGSDCSTAQCPQPPPQTQACCFGDGTCSDLVDDVCLSEEGIPQGEGTDCATASCPQPLQACCFAEGICSDLTETECLDQGGVAQGLGTDCTTADCPLVTEACCMADGTCHDMSAEACFAPIGIPQGPGTECATAICSYPTEACCKPDGTCQDLWPDVCHDVGGTPQGTGTDCATANCTPPTQACCFVDGSCSDMTEEACLREEGNPQGVGTDCTKASCPQPTQACCFADGSCGDLTESACMDQGGTPQGIDTNCDTTTCTPATERVRIYWTTLGGEIASARPDGTDIKIHLQSEYRPDDIDITFNKDAVGLNAAYWFSKDSTYIRSAPLNTGTWTAQWLSVPIEGQMRGLAVGMSGTDGTGNYLTWTELLTGPLPANPAVLPMLGMGNGVVKKLDLDIMPFAPTTLYARSVNTIEGALATMSFGMPGIDGTTAKTFGDLGAKGIPMAVASADSVWWSEWVWEPPGTGDMLWRGDLAGNPPLPMHPPLPPLETRQVIGGFYYAGFAYWSQQTVAGTQINCSLPNGAPLPGFTPIVIPEKYIANIAFDWFNGKVYWTVPNANKIMRANIDGSGIEDFLTAGQTDLADLTEVSGIAVGVVLESPTYSR